MIITMACEVSRQDNAIVRLVDMMPSAMIIVALLDTQRRLS